MTTHPELRPIADLATSALSALMPFTHGSGHDSHGDPVPDGEAVIRRGLLALIEAGRLADAALARSDALASLRDASTEFSE
ncbi:MAG: hypothetical protein E6Q97_17005 [Desulfurellales bacterium]|nr:MAG: hypothetical protein E6Q97_17005 [Desulfurellales bacterium]